MHFTTVDLKRKNITTYSVWPNVKYVKINSVFMILVRKNP